MAQENLEKRTVGGGWFYNFFSGSQGVPTYTSWATPALDEVRLMMARDFSECQKGEVVKILTGEGNTKFWNHDMIKKAMLEAIGNGVLIKCIVGPAMNVDDDDHNFLLEQALKPYGGIDLYVAPRRELTHYRVFGNRKLWMEKYHEPLAISGNREGRYIISGEENPLGIFMIQKYARDFDAIIQVYHMEKIKGKEEVVFLRDKELENLTQLARSKRQLFDDYDREKLASLKNELEYAV